MDIGTVVSRDGDPMSTEPRKFVLIVPDGLDIRRFQWKYEADFPVEPERHAEAVMLIGWLTRWPWLSGPPSWIGLPTVSMPIQRARVVTESGEVLTL